jgi:hypothetical protein
MRYFDLLDEQERDGFRIVIDMTPEDLNPRDCFDYSVTDIDEIIKDINRGHLDWFMLRVRAIFDGHEMGSAYLGGMLYEDPKECLKDGSAEDMIKEALTDAKDYVKRLKEKLNALTVE